MVIMIICPECKDFVPYKILSTETLISKMFGTIEIHAYECPKHHIFADLHIEDLDDKRIKFIKQLAKEENQNTAQEAEKP